ncbi:DUF4003 family protein [Salibacterium halotolerans]|uniref:DUF4003 domain-containing protein n=1 Tax=Salibacterium halotolerans TaxID=1884432 RepID=A0A1I5SB49_9BACI|nr:DUF4003 family protein [Salibacterium halotolerans]SFP67940.1 Protein of unknown function [Salibacterium halotolerans]
MVSSKIEQYVDDYETLKKALRWKVFDDLVIMNTASIYVMNGRTLDTARFLELAEQLKKRSGMFSSMNSPPRFTMAGMLDASMEDAEASVPELFRVYQILKDHHFRSGASTYMAAFTVMKNSAPSEETARRTMDLFQKMKKEHPMLTDANDYPLAVLLAMEKENDMVEKIETCYDALKREGLTSGNHLQFLSHILTLGSEGQPQQAAGRSAEMMETWKQSGWKAKTMYYPVIGVLSLLPDELIDMEAIHEMAGQLNETKALKRSKDMNILVAATFFISDHIEEAGLAEAGLHTSVEAIIQAQQTAMIAAVSAAAASSSAATSSN